MTIRVVFSRIFLFIFNFVEKSNNNNNNNSQQQHDVLHDHDAQRQRRAASGTGISEQYSPSAVCTLPNVLRGCWSGGWRPNTKSSDSSVEAAVKRRTKRRRRWRLRSLSLTPLSPLRCSPHTNRSGLQWAFLVKRPRRGRLMHVQVRWKGQSPYGFPPSQWHSCIY